MRVIGIDPGLATVGIGIVEESLDGKLVVIDYCTIETEPSLALPARLLEISDDLAEMLRTHAPDIAVVEKLYFGTNSQTAISVAEARGVILITIEEAGIPIIEPTPLELKSSVTGDGRADKVQMKLMLERALNLDFSGVRDDAIDALGLALYGISMRSALSI